jgi:hypothetical protein
MSDGLSDRTTSILTGAIGLAASLSYIVAARGIEDSLLADAVGASGVPVAVGILMAVSSSALLIKALLPKATDKAEPAQESQEPEVSPMRAHALAMGLIAILAGYLVVLPWLGYNVSVGLLACVVAWFAGGRERNTLIGFAVLTGPVLWFFFDYALKIHMPAGFWPALFSG